MSGVINLRTLKKKTFIINPPRAFLRGRRNSPQWDWERQLNKTERRVRASDIVKGIILDNCSYLQPKMSSEITKLVNDAYGSLAHRCVLRYISELVADGKLKKVMHPVDEEFVAYLLAGPRRAKGASREVPGAL